MFVNIGPRVATTSWGSDSAVRGFGVEYSRRCLTLIFVVFAVLIVPFLAGSVSAQGGTRRSGLDLAPSNLVGMPGTTAGLPQGSNSLYLNSGMFRDILGPIPNLEIGYLYQFGNKIRTGRLSLDYVLPATVRGDQAIFAEAHGEFTNFWKTLQRLLRSGNSTTTYSGYHERTDLSFGGGYRKLFGDSLMLGVNGFYDTSKLGRRWYGSGGLGFEMAALGAGNDLVELTFNYYGDIFQGRNSIINAFRTGPSNFDVSARYSIELGDYGPDLRLKATGYQFDIGTRRYGWNTEAEVRTRNGMFSVKAGTGHDPVNGWYHTVGGFVNVGLDVSNLLNGKSPFEPPEPIFRSPRNLRRLLAQKVNREYVSPPAKYARRLLGRGNGSAPGPPPPPPPPPPHPCPFGYHMVLREGRVTAGGWHGVAYCYEPRAPNPIILHIRWYNLLHDITGTFILRVKACVDPSWACDEGSEWTCYPPGPPQPVSLTAGDGYVDAVCWLTGFFIGCSHWFIAPSNYDFIEIGPGGSLCLYCTDFFDVN